MSKTLKLKDFKANTKEWFLEQLSNMPASQALQTISDLYDELHKPKYPKTYEECLDVLSMDYARHYNLRYFTYERGFYEYATTDKLCSLQDKLNILGKLIICRNAYWKIAGEHLELDKPWRPVWDESEDLYTIHTFNGEIRLSGTAHRNAILVFPTEEMRDVFYKNFKGLIEQCKELL